jgi:hypothetical protein
MFQTIQAAHEVLTDAEQRSKYDSGRARSSTKLRGYGSAYTHTPAPRGNPYANAGAGFAPPPKPHGTPRARGTAPTAASGASRYSKFGTSTAGASSSTFNTGASAKTNYQAWTNMKQDHKAGYSMPRREEAPKSGREESNNAKHTTPKSNKPGFQEFRNGAKPGVSPQRPPPIPKRNGFAPGTPGGDEPPAGNTSSYNTQRQAPIPQMQRERAVPDFPPQPAGYVDPLRQFRAKVDPEFDNIRPRVSTPYSSHGGGEKTNPFESATLGRSRSTREAFGSNKVGRAQYRHVPGSADTRKTSGETGNRRRSTSPHINDRKPTSHADFSVGSPPKRTRSHANFSPTSNRTQSTEAPKTRANARATMGEDDSTSESDSGSETDGSFHAARGPFGRKFATPRPRGNKFSASPRSNVPPKQQPEVDSTSGSENSRKSNIGNFQRWWSQQKAEEDVLNHSQTGGPRESRPFEQKEEPTMYAPTHSYYPISRVSAPMKYKIIDENPQMKAKRKSVENIWPDKVASSEAKETLFPHIRIPTTYRNHKLNLGSPSEYLNVFEQTQFNLVDLLINRSGGGRPDAESCKRCGQIISSAQCNCKPMERNPPSVPRTSRWAAHFQSAADAGSPQKRRPGGAQKTSDIPQFYSQPLDYFSDNRQNPTLSSGYANSSCINSFSFPINTDTFASTKPAPFVNASTESISTTFSPDDWHGKFEAGDYFANDQGQRAKVPPRTRSGSRARGRSPVKGRPGSATASSTTGPSVPEIDPTNLGRPPADEPPMESPGGTKFSAEEWKQTFKAQTFAPPPHPSPSALRTQRSFKRSRPPTVSGKGPNIIKTAGGKAAVVESESFDEESIYVGRPAGQTTRPSSAKSTGASPATAADAMDIDPPSAQTSASPGKATGEARNVPLEPSRPEWRAGDAIGPQSAPKQPDLPPRVSPALPPRESSTKTNYQAPPADDEEDFKVDLDELKNIEPLHNPAQGLGSMKDLDNSLPFPSQASSTFAKTPRTGHLELPSPPKAPTVPSAPSEYVRPTQASWQSYLISFKAYMAEWDLFNSKMLSHFLARKNQIDLMPANWLESRSDEYINMYKLGQIEDARVREWWSVANEKHAAAMAEFARFRFSMKTKSEREAAWDDGLKKS